MFRLAVYGRAWTDLFQFVLKMAIVISVAGTEFTRLAGCRNFSRRLRRGVLLPVREPATSPPLTRFFPRLPAKLVDVAGDYFWVHLTVQWWRSGIRERNLAAVDTSRNGFSAQRTKGTDVVGAVVQPGALRAAALALDFDGARGGCSLSGAGTTERGYMLVRRGRHRMRYWDLLAGFMAAFMSTVATQLIGAVPT